MTETAEMLQMKINGQEIPQTFIHELKLYIDIPGKKINGLFGVNSNPVDVKGCPEIITYQKDDEKLKITCHKCKKEINPELGDCYHACNIAITTINMFNDIEKLNDLKYAKATFINPIANKALNTSSTEGRNISHNFTMSEYGTR